MELIEYVKSLCVVDANGRHTTQSSTNRYGYNVIIEMLMYGDTRSDSVLSQYEYDTIMNEYSEGGADRKILITHKEEPSIKYVFEYVFMSMGESWVNQYVDDVLYEVNEIEKIQVDYVKK